MASTYDYLRNGYKVGEYGLIEVGLCGTVTAIGDDWIEIEGSRVPLRLGGPAYAISMVMHECDEDRRDSSSDGGKGNASSTDAANAVVAALDGIGGADPECAHDEADGLILTLVPEEVRRAHRDLVNRCSWWATA